MGRKKKCSAPGCMSSSEETGSIFFNFPRDSARWQQHCTQGVMAAMLPTNNMRVSRGCSGACDIDGTNRLTWWNVKNVDMENIERGEAFFLPHLEAPEEILSNIKIEPDDSKLELQIALKKESRETEAAGGCYRIK